MSALFLCGCGQLLFILLCFLRPRLHSAGDDVNKPESRRTTVYHHYSELLTLEQPRRTKEAKVANQGLNKSPIVTQKRNSSSHQMVPCGSLSWEMATLHSSV